MRIVGLFLRAVSYLYHFLLALFLFLIAVITLLGPQHNLEMGMLPWKGAALTYWLFWLGLTGLVATALAALGIFRYLFPPWTLFVLIMMVRGYFLSSYTYGGSDHFRTVVWLVVGAIVTFLVSLTLLRRPKRVHA